ncbi:MAG: WD40/YVTN/BNR-like repeat-containing protein [Longimicrobiales bacterium]
MSSRCQRRPPSMRWVVRGLSLAVLALGSGCRGGDEPAEAGPGAGDRAPELALILQTSGTTALLQAVSPVSEDVVWVSGHEGTWARTVDGGETWSAFVMAGEENLQFRDVEAFGPATAYLMSAGSGDLSRIYRTDDAGESWVLQYTADHPDAFLDCLAFWDPDRGLAYGDAVDGVPFLLHTEDGGASWDRIPAEALPPATEGEGGFAASGTCVATGPEGKAWVATGNGDRARVLRTTDWGRSWEAVDVPVVGGSGAGLTTIRMGPENRVGLALGGVIGGDTLRTENVAVTEDGGVTWTPGSAPAMPGPVYGSALVGAPQRGGEVGGNLAGRTPTGSETLPPPVAVIVGPRGLDWSLDLGRSWKSATEETYWAVAFASPEAGWAVGPGGRIARLGMK